MKDDPFSAGHPGMDQLSAYFTAWGRAIQQAAGMPAGAPGTQGADGWSAAAAGGPWLQAICQLARQGLEQDLDSAGLAAAWRQILRQGLWPDAPATPAAGNADWLELPVFGPWREHISRWQQQARHSQQAQEVLLRWQAQMQQVRDEAVARFESLLREHESDPLANVRALLDLWVEAAEQAWQQAAGSPEFARLLAELGQSQLDAWQAQQEEMQRGLQAMGLATRRELDQAWQRIDALERQLAALLAGRGAPAPAAADAGSSMAGSAGSRPAARRTAAAGKPGAAAARKPTAARAAAGKTAAGNAATGARTSAKAATKAGSAAGRGKRAGR